MAEAPYRDRNWRVARYRVGAWAFFLHRLSGVAIALYGITHVLVMAYARTGADNFNRLLGLLQQPWVLAMEMLLLAVIFYHFLNGFRVILFDLGVGIRRQKGLFWGLMALGVVLLAVTVIITLPFILGRALT